MAHTTVDEAGLRTGNGNIFARLSGEDGHITLLVSPKSDDFLSRILIVVPGQAEGTNTYCLSDLLSAVKPLTEEERAKIVAEWRSGE